jgi:hypothetical protein
MRSLTIVIVVTAVLLAGLAAGCKTLAMSGKEKYKVDMNNVYVKVHDEINNSGAVSQETVTKMEKTMESYRAEFGTMGSFTEGQKALDFLKKGLADPSEAFSMNQQAQSFIDSSQEFLKTEVDNG